MAAKRIPQLDALTSASVAGADQLVVFDTDANATKRVTRADLYAASNGATYVGYLQSGSGVEPRTVQGKLSDVVGVKDFGAVGDGVTDDTAAITAAAAQSPYFAPPGTYVSTGVNFSALSGRQYGFGQVKTADGNKSAPNFALVKSAPTSLGDENSILTAFNGDMSKCQFAVGHLITGTATLGQPTTGYLYRPEAMPHYTYLNNLSGWNESTSGNGGRTGVAAYRTRVFQQGQGDAVCYNGSVFVTGTRSGSTNFLANPAGVLFNGDMTAGADGVYMNPYETICADQGYDVACVGVVNNFVRTNNTGAKNVVWMGYRAQSVGTQPVDAFLSASGPGGFNNGLDLVTANFGANQSAISLAANQRIYFNNTATPPSGGTIAFVTNNYAGEWMRYSSGSAQIQFAGQDAVQFGIGRTLNAVNYFGVLGGVTGNAPQFRTFGSDTNINAGYVTKGTGFHFFYSNNTNSVQFGIDGLISNAVNFALARGAATGSGPRIIAAGSDTDIDLDLAAKGAGVLNFVTGTDATAGALTSYMVIKVAGTSYKVPLYAMS